MWVAITLGKSIHRAERREIEVGTIDDEMCERTELPKAWCQHCKTPDDVHRRQTVVKARRRGTQPTDLT